MKSQSVFLSRVLPVVLLLLLASPLNTKSQPAPLVPVAFEVFVEQRYRRDDPAWSFQTFCPTETNPVANRVLREYGAMFAATEAVVLPPVCIFGGESEVIRFQKKLATKTLDVKGIHVALQAAAADALQRVIDEAAAEGRSVTAFDGAIAGSRTYGQTLMLWNGRFFAALDYWTRNGRLTAADREEISGVALQKRIEKILEWESRGIYFSTDRRRSILTSTAPPGASQHLSMLAFDVAEYGHPRIREILSRNGWYQTVVGDPLHFTFLGVPESELPARGLRMVTVGGHFYWVPNLSAATH